MTTITVCITCRTPENRETKEGDPMGESFLPAMEKAAAKHGITVRGVACLIYGTFHRNDFEAMRLLLGHTSTSTAIRYYAMIEQDAVHRAYAGILKSLMGEDDA